MIEEKEKNSNIVKNVYEVTIEKRLSKKNILNAKNDIEAMDFAKEFMINIEIESLNPNEEYIFETNKIAENDKEYLKENNISLPENNECDDEENCDSCKYYCPTCGECTYDE